uniref:uncharacterized protein LOC105351937 n=1 Tax=Fragaria vesca subsp. vesca TaxID=101020 RepID=UPI0005C9EE68|nr:PREDICTED: uncharacterized protein LOC105351937 [Fragaria vesca subsp. vesca]
MVSKLSREEMIKVVDQAKHALAAECLTDQLEEMDLNNEGSYTPIPFRSEFMVPYNEDSKVNSKQTATSSPVGGELSYIVVSQFIVPDNEGSNCKQTATYGPVGGIDMSQFIVPHNEGSNCEQTATYGPVGAIDMSQFIVPHVNQGSKVNCEQTATYIPVGLSSSEDYYGDMFQFVVPDNEGSKVNSKQTATYSPVSVMPMFRGPVTGEGSYR